MGVGRALTASPQRRPDIQNKENKVRNRVTHRTGLWEAAQLGKWRLGPERLSDLPRVTQMAAKILAMVGLGEVHLVCQNLLTLFYTVLLTTLGLMPSLWRVTHWESFMCHRILQTTLPSKSSEPLCVSSGWH